jgi:hypothetical protein
MSNPTVSVPDISKEGTLSDYVRISIEHLISSNMKHLEGKLLTFLECITDSEVRQKSLKDVARSIIQESLTSMYQYSDSISKEVEMVVGEESQNENSQDILSIPKLKYKYTRLKS